MTNRDKFILAVAAIITIVWAIGAIVSLYRKDYGGLSIITPVMLTVAGFVFGFGRKGNGKEK